MSEKKNNFGLIILIIIMSLLICGLVGYTIYFKNNDKFDTKIDNDINDKLDDNNTVSNSFELYKNNLVKSLKNNSYGYVLREYVIDENSPISSLILLANGDVYATMRNDYSTSFLSKDDVDKINKIISSMNVIPNVMEQGNSNVKGYKLNIGEVLDVKIMKTAQDGSNLLLFIMRDGSLKYFSTSFGQIGYKMFNGDNLNIKTSELKNIVNFVDLGTNIHVVSAIDINGNIKYVVVDTAN